MKKGSLLKLQKSHEHIAVLLQDPRNSQVDYWQFFFFLPALEICWLFEKFVTYYVTYLLKCYF